MPKENLELDALINKQWIKEWDKVQFNNENRRKPEPYFYIFSINANTLKRLSKVYPRTADQGRRDDSGIQRRHDPQRSNEIRKYVDGGFPWSELNNSQKKNPDNANLRMPGWLPTAIIANILAPNATRGASKLKVEDSVSISQTSNNYCKIKLPEKIQDKDWDPEVAPIEIIDGQHRLWAFEKDEVLDGDYEFPVIAFYDLDIAWQAYLFYTINIKPKKINASLAFDLYPILRVQEWLEASPEGNQIYKETRAQELTEVLWSHPASPWKGRINMLGESNSGLVTQAAFIRSLIASFIKGSTKGLGGLFGALIELKDIKTVLPWNRPQQAAFLIFIWQSISENLKDCNAEWAVSIRNLNLQLDFPNMDLDMAFISRYSLLTTDQGVRGVLHVFNDMFYLNALTLNLFDIRWNSELREDYIGVQDVNEALKQFEKSKVKKFADSLSKELLKFNWSTSSAPYLNDADRQKQMIYRGSGGYKELRRQLLLQLSESNESDIKSTASSTLQILGY